MIILGISFLSDASAVIVRDGRLVAAVAEERLNRVKQWNGMPLAAVDRVLALAGITLDQVDIVATHGAAPPAPESEPYREKERAIRAASLPAEVAEAQLRRLAEREAHERRVLGERTPAYLAEVKALGRPVEVHGHHEAHAATGFYGRGVGDGWILTIDGWGEDGSSSLWRAEGAGMSRVAFSNSFDSLGYFYGAVTKALGFIPHRHEGKVLGLAAYCPEPKSLGELRAMVDYDPGRFRFLGRMERGYVPRMDNPGLAPLIARLPREDIAAGTQQTLEQVVSALIDDLGAGPHRLMVAGGVFANVKLNQRLAERPNVSDVYVFPNMGDGGLAAGAAWLSYARRTGRVPERFSTALLGPAPSEDEVLHELRTSGLAYDRPGDMEDRVGELLAAKAVVARCAGPMEYGPRALGNRSILYQASDPGVNDWLNRRLKRSEFMPFAPASLAEAAGDLYLGLDSARETAKYMAITFACTKKMREEAPAAVHVDGTARPQIVDAESYPAFHRILSSYRRRTGRTSVINTSFNMHEEPIVCSAADAMRAFRASDLPYLVLGDYLVSAPSAA